MVSLARECCSSADADRFLYGYDRAGNRTWKENDVAANLGTPVHLDELYEYDEVYRLIAADRGNLNGTQDGIVNGTAAFSQDWGLDATGNWDSFDEDADGNGTNELVQTRDHNEVNETGTIGATTGTNWADPIHDRAGNMTSMPKPSDPASSITAKYDAWNRLVEVSDGGILVAKFRYDGDGRRILKMFDTDAPGDPDGLDTYEHMFLSGNQVIETREGSGETPAQAETLQPKYQNVWSPRYIDALILRDENTDQDGLCDDARIFYLADANYNVTALIDTSGDVLERYLYSPYGEATILDADFTPDADGVSDYTNTTLYTGRGLDPATGLYYYQARYYHAGLGRFVARDVLGYEDGMNGYQYVGGNPLAFVDPSGMQGMDIDLGRIWWEDQPTKPPPPSIAVALGNPQAEKLFEELMAFVKGRPRPGCLLDPCFRWGNKTNNALPPYFSKPPIVVEAVFFKVSGSMIADAHMAFKVTFPDGSVYYFDEGGPYSTFCGALGGRDRWFTPGNIPENYVEAPQDEVIPPLSKRKPSCCKPLNNDSPWPMGKPGACFSRQTPVFCNGSWRAIGSVRPGDRVLAWDPSTSQVVEASVLEVDLHTGHFDMLEIETSQGEVIEVTEDHPFFDGASWVSAVALAITGRVMTASGDVVVAGVRSGCCWARNVYNLRTDCGTYLVGHAALIASGVVHEQHDTCRDQPGEVHLG